MISKGDVILARDVKVSDKKEFQIEFTPTAAMVPKANFVVFYITDDGEIVSDSLKLEFGNELRNFVSIFDHVRLKLPSEIYFRSTLSCQKIRQSLARTLTF